MSYYAVVSLFIFKEDWNAYHPNSPVFETVLSPFDFEKQNSFYVKESLSKVNYQRRAWGNIPLHKPLSNVLGTAPFSP